ncbi:MAG: patatin-like phospholipase family protein [Bacteroidia bacterium]
MRIFLNKACLTYTLLLFCLAQSASGQTYRNLVLEGAGIRGIAYSGALMELQEHKILDSISRVGGTSAGAITALAVSIGYSPQEIYEIVANTPFQKFNDGRFLFFGGFRRLNKNYGWYMGEAFSNWLSDLIEKKTGNKDITFRQLREKGFKDLYITGTSLNRQKLIVFSHENYPDMKVRDAVRISMSIPLYYQAVWIDSVGNIIRKPKNTQGLDLMVDGGIMGNFPIHIFDSTKYFSANAYMDSAKNAFAKNPETIGVRIDSDEQINFDLNNNGLAPFEINGFKDYVSAFYNIIIENLNRQSLDETDWKRTISVSSVNIGPKVKKLSDQQKNMLVESGKKGVKVFLGK